MHDATHSCIHGLKYSYDYYSYIAIGYFIFNSLQYCIPSANVGNEFYGNNTWGV